MADESTNKTAPAAGTDEADNPSWHRVQLARHPKRPHSLDYINGIFSHFEELHGDRFFGYDASIFAGMAKLDAKPVIVIGQQTGADGKEKVLRNVGMPEPEACPKAMRVTQLASKVGRPIITLIATPGPSPGIDAEDRRQAAAIAYTLCEMPPLRTPVISVG